MSEDKETKPKARIKNPALKDFHIFMPPKLDIQIKEGDDIDALNLPKNLLMNLKTEKVMKG